MDLLEKLKLQIMPIRLKYKRQTQVLKLFFFKSSYKKSCYTFALLKSAPQQFTTIHHIVMQYLLHLCDM